MDSGRGAISQSRWDWCYPDGVEKDRGVGKSLIRVCPLRKSNNRVNFPKGIRNVARGCQRLPREPETHSDSILKGLRNRGFVWKRIGLETNRTLANGKKCRNR